MNQEHDNKLCADFPKIFAQRHGKPMETCMCWGFSCGDGWYDLVHKLCTDIQAHCDTLTDDYQVVALQVKEKFGGLRFYVGGGDETTQVLIDKAESDSFTTCEECGSTENVTRKQGGWIRYLCQPCQEPKEKVDAPAEES